MLFWHSIIIKDKIINKYNPDTLLFTPSIKLVPFIKTIIQKDVKKIKNNIQKIKNNILFLLSSK
jgi:hypothetical protein